MNVRVWNSRGPLFRFTSLGLLLLVAACKQGPDFQQPQAPRPTVYQSEGIGGESVANVPWWDLYRDPVLQKLIDDGLTNNRSLREAFAKITESRATLGMVKADLYPSLNIIGAGFYQQTGQADSVSTFDNFKLAASASYEIDLWGRISRSKEAAMQGLLATEEAFRTVTISLVADIAGAYLVLRDLDFRIAIAEEMVATRRESLDLLASRAEGGLVPMVTLRQAEVDLADSEAVVQKLFRARAQTENGLNLLVGSLPSEVERGVALEGQTFPPAVPAGLPSELLQRRPDILGAERRLHAQTAVIGVAEAARFPSISLTSSLGIKTSSLGGVTASNSFLNLGANILGPLFTAGKRGAQVEAERARAEQMLHQYEQIVLNAFREVEDALVAVETHRVEHEARVRQMEAAQEGLDVAQALYEGGLGSYMEVLDLQRAYFGAELMVSEALQLHHSAIVQLYKALGGGWSVEERGEPEES